MKPKKDIDADDNDKVSLDTRSEPFTLERWLLGDSSGFKQEKVPPSLIDESRVGLPSAKQHTCPPCNSEFSDQDNLNDHLLLAHGVGRSFRCDRCVARFEFVGGLKRHFREEHNSESSYPCMRCSKSFEKSDDLCDHIKLGRCRKQTVILTEEEMEKMKAARSLLLAQVSAFGANQNESKAR